jgi:hypothetical protein
MRTIEDEPVVPFPTVAEYSTIQLTTLGYEVNIF